MELLLQPVQRPGFSIVVMINSWSYVFSQWLKLIAGVSLLETLKNKHARWIHLHVSVTDHKCSIGISSIFDTVFRCLTIFLSVLDTLQCLPREVIKGSGHVPSKKVKIAYWTYFHFVKFRRICMSLYGVIISEQNGTSIFETICHTMSASFWQAGFPLDFVLSKYPTNSIISKIQFLSRHHLKLYSHPVKCVRSRNY